MDFKMGHIYLIKKEGVDRTIIKIENLKDDKIYFKYVIMPQKHVPNRVLGKTYTWDLKHRPINCYKVTPLNELGMILYAD